SPVQTIPPWYQTGVPLHFHSSTISGSASCTRRRTLASIFPRQSPSSLILSSINAEADSADVVFFIQIPRLALILAPLLDAPQEIGECPEYSSRRRPAPCFGTVAHGEVSDQRRGEIDGEAGVSPFLEARRHRHQNQQHAEEFGPREFHAEVLGEAEVA